MKNSERFLNSFNKIENHLRKLISSDRYVTFYTLVDDASKKNSAVNTYRTDLKEFADLRNAIIHERTDEHVIAEPNDATVEEIERIAVQITQPTKVSQVMAREVFSLSVNQPIANAVSGMFQRSFSQVPVYRGNQFAALLTTNTIARWLGAAVAEDIISLEETPIEHVLDYTEETDNYCFLASQATVFDVLDKFRSHEAKGIQLEAILVTHSGKPKEKILGMITIWDLPKIYKMIRPSS